MDNENKLLRITTASVMMALTCVLTMAVRIPSPTKGYMNLGDCAVLTGGWLLGPLWGTVVGGVGSAFADFLSGYPVYIPGTLIIKASMALIVSIIPYRFAALREKHFRLSFILTAVVAELIMIIGYYFYEAAIIGVGFLPALAGVSGNAFQGIVGVIGSYFLVEILNRTGLTKHYHF